MAAVTYELIHKDATTGARAGILHTPHGDFKTPIFMPVGTNSTVKLVTNNNLYDTGAQIILGNSYHLYLRAGHKLIEKFGGIHGWMNWKKPVLTDSGGFQVFSLGPLRRIDEDGVTFKSYIDGSMHRLTPESSIGVQEKLGADIIMSFDECADPFDKAYNERAMARTHRWLERCIKAKRRPDQALFGIVQGGIFADLREESAKFVASHDLPGYAIGGLSVGESKEDMNTMMELMDYHFDHLPVWIDGNAYFNGAKAWNREENKLVLEDGKVLLELVEKDGEYTLKTDVYSYLKDFRVGMINSEILGKAFEPEERYENPDGSDILFNEDYFGDHRGASVIPGPFVSEDALKKILWK